MAQLQKFVGITLVDITNTGVIRHSKDNELQRDQQRNWETVMQVIGIKAQPMLIEGPVSKVMDISDSVFGDMYQGEHRVWFWTFATEHEGVFEKDGDPVAGLNELFDQVPIISGLNETARFLLPIFYTKGAIKNVQFKVGNFELNTI